MYVLLIHFEKLKGNLYADSRKGVYA